MSTKASVEGVSISVSQSKLAGPGNGHCRLSVFILPAITWDYGPCPGCHRLSWGSAKLLMGCQGSAKNTTHTRTVLSQLPRRRWASSWPNPHSPPYQMPCRFTLGIETPVGGTEARASETLFITCMKTSNTRQPRILPLVPSLRALYSEYRES